MRILLVEDDPELGDGLSVGLRQAGFAVNWLPDGEAADRALQVERFDLAVLDLGLPGMGGMAVLQRARQRGLDLPILILTARDATGDKVAGLDAGADDYLVKPIDLDELAARIRALTRRSAGRAAAAPDPWRLDTRPGSPSGAARRSAGRTGRPRIRPAPIAARKRSAAC